MFEMMSQDALESSTESANPSFVLHQLLMQREELGFVLVDLILDCC